jgi:Arc/MetJ family transcription regulator
MARTNVVLDDELVEKVKALYGIKTTREAIHFALLALVSRHDRNAMLDLEGAGWDGDLDSLRSWQEP